MSATSARMQREKRTVSLMIRLFCREQHGGSGELCPECATLDAYAMQRLEKCPFAPEKPACADCRVHCYQPKIRGRIRAVMRYAGPRMLLRHPWLALMHLLDSRKKPS